MHNRRSKSRTSRTVVLILCFLLLAILAGGVIVGRGALDDVSVLLDSVDTVKAEANDLVAAAKTLDMDGVEAGAQSLLQVIREDREILNKPLWRYATKTPRVGGDLDTARELLDIAESGIQELLLPAVAVVRENSDFSRILEEKDTEAAMELANVYFELADTSLPLVHKYMDAVMALPPMHVDKLESKMEQLRGYIRTAEEYLPMVEEVLPLVRDELFPYACMALKDGIPTKEDFIAEDGGIHVALISHYLPLAEELVPVLRARLPELLQSDLLQLSEKTAAYAEKLSHKLDEVWAVYDHAEPYLPLLKSFLANGEDRVYFLAAQNSAEIRACGGFPGSIGYIRITDGMMYIEYFTTVYEMLPKSTYTNMEEEDMFTAMIFADRDAVVNPYFPAIAPRWTKSYEKWTGDHINGVVSATPAIVQELLKVAGPITLSEGTELDGSNASAFLQNGIYLQYVNRVQDGGQDFSDQLFSETVVLTMEKMFSDITLEKLDEYISVFERCIEKRIIMVWLEDEEGEEIARELGCDGGFNTDPTRPQLGVFFNNYNASKLGWYLDLDVDVGEPTVNEDGSYSYPVTVTMANTLQQKDIPVVGFYVVAASEGIMSSRIYFSAPAGGSVTDVKYEGQERTYFVAHQYYGSQLTCSTFFQLYPGWERKIHLTVNTAPGEQEALRVVTTPTMMEYRRAAESES